MIELTEKTITYDLHPAQGAPRVGLHIVSIGRTTGKVGTVYRILSVTPVRARTPRNFCRYRLVVVVCPGAVRFGHVIYQASKRKVWVDGRRALPLYWYPRTKKTARTKAPHEVA